MNHHRFLSLLPVGLVLVGLSCAPVDDEPNKPGVSPPKERVSETPIPLPPEMPRDLQALQPRLRAAIDNVRQRDLLATNSFWTVFHGILGLGLDVQLLDPARNERVNAVEYIRKGGKIRGLEFIPTGDGVDVKIGPTFLGQGHQDQFVAEMVQQGLPPDAPFTIGDKVYPFLDFVRHSKMRASVKGKEELSWTIVAVGQFYGTDIRWTNNAGEDLHFEDLIRYETTEPINGAACGGTHRLFGLTWSYHMHMLKGGKKTAVWQKAAERIAQYQGLARQYQNKAEGFFSTSYFEGPGDVKSDQLRISTTGHILEWLSLSLPDEELRQEWVTRAVHALSVLILNNREEAIESGAMYHAVHGLLLYHSRVFGPIPGYHMPPCPPPPIESRKN